MVRGNRDVQSSQFSDSLSDEELFGFFAQFVGETSMRDRKSVV